ncbi:MAG: LOG family protein [Acidobacteria bacterium]|nr:LOG family protein [Acidobacteriota bacterium]
MTKEQFRMHRKPRKIPRPPGDRRRVPLPQSRIQVPPDDPGAEARLQSLLEGASYVRPDRDVDLLQRGEMRAVRLLLDYMKPELALERERIRSTIVLFGGTRIVEPALAREGLEKARAALRKSPKDPERKRRVAVEERILAKSRFYHVAREFARIVSGSCQVGGRCEFVIITGGGPGIMEAGNRGAFDIGAKTIGLNITLPHEQYPNPYITPGLCFQFRYFALRKLHFLLRAKALVAFPGGYGTLDELFETLTLIQTRTVEPMPVILVGEEFWRNAFDADFLAAEGVIDPEDIELFAYAETAKEIWSHITGWYRSRGNDILKG